MIVVYRVRLVMSIKKDYEIIKKDDKSIDNRHAKWYTLIRNKGREPQR